jgi:hypothetical protein
MLDRGLAGKLNAVWCSGDVSRSGECWIPVSLLQSNLEISCLPFPADAAMSGQKGTVNRRDACRTASRQVERIDLGSNWSIERTSLGRPV